MNEYFDAAARGRARRQDDIEWESRAVGALARAVSAVRAEFRAEGQKVADALRQAGLKPESLSFTQRYWRLGDNLPKLRTNGAWCTVESVRSGLPQKIIERELASKQFGSGPVVGPRLNELVDKQGELIKGASIPTSFFERGYETWDWGGIVVRDGLLYRREVSYGRETPLRDALALAVEARLRG